MAAPVYSTRFLAGSGTGASQSIVVPAGKRAVVRSVVICVFGAEVAYYYVRVNYVEIAFDAAASPNTTRVFDLRAVAYEGETIDIASSAQALAWHVDGYLFADT